MLEAEDLAVHTHSKNMPAWHSQFRMYYCTLRNHFVPAQCRLISQVSKLAFQIWQAPTLHRSVVTPVGEHIHCARGSLLITVICRVEELATLRTMCVSL